MKILRNRKSSSRSKNTKKNGDVAASLKGLADSDGSYQKLVADFSY